MRCNDGPAIPFGTELRYTPSSSKDGSRLHQLVEKKLNGVLMVYVPRAGERQSSDWLKADCEDLEKCLPPRSTSRDSGI